MWNLLSRGYDYAFDDDISVTNPPIPASSSVGLLSTSINGNVTIETDENNKRHNNTTEEESDDNVPKRPKLGDFIGLNQSRVVRPSSYSREFTAITSENDSVGNTTQPTVDDGSLPQCNCRTAVVLRTVVKDGPNKGKGFYSCSKNGADKCGYFQWKDNNQSVESRSNTRNAVSSDVAVTPMCLCNPPEPSIIRVVSKEGSNKGKQFYCCSKKSRDQQCKYFAFINENAASSGDAARTQTSTASATTSAMNCKCNVAAKVLKVKKEGPNCGKEFYTCSTKTCNFFQFI